MKKFSVLLFFIVLIFHGFAQNVPKEMAEQVGSNFLNNSLGSFNYEKSAKTVSSYAEIKTKAGLPAMHVFNYKNGGFVIVSSDKRSVPVLAYSFDTHFDIDNIAPATSDWISSLSKQIEEIVENNYQSTDDIEQMWLNYKNNQFEKSYKGVDKLLETRWNQNYPYNYFCPQHPAGPGGRVYAGCVATAMAQIMKFYDYPEKGRHSAEYFWGQWLEVDFSETYYAWDEMTPTINSLSRDAIAELMFHCGVSVNMNYDYTGSGSSILNSYYAMRHYFQYRSGMEHLEMHQFEIPEWQFVLRNDLDQGRPILYRGVSDQGDGHAYVVDGYQNDDFFHFNWGWGGSADGFYYLDEVNPQTLFPWNQAAVVNITPGYADYCSNVVMTQPAWTFNDGSGPNLYFKDTDCEWLISIDADTCDFITLSFNRFDVVEGDMVRVYDGNNQSSEILGEFTGNEIPPVITSSSNEMLITFETTGSQQGVGWEASYESIILNSENFSVQDVKVFPNPTEDILNIITNSDEYVNISVYDIYGKKHYAMKENGNINIDISTLSAGIYLLKVENDKQSFTKRIVKM